MSLIPQTRHVPQAWAGMGCTYTTSVAGQFREEPVSSGKRRSSFPHGRADENGLRQTAAAAALQVNGQCPGSEFRQLVARRRSRWRSSRGSSWCARKDHRIGMGRHGQGCHRVRSPCLARDSRRPAGGPQRRTTVGAPRTITDERVEAPITRALAEQLFATLGHGQRIADRPSTATGVSLDQGPGTRTGGPSGLDRERDPRPARRRLSPITKLVISKSTEFGIQAAAAI